MTKDEKTQALIDRASKCCQKIADFYEISTSKVIWMGTNRFKVIKNNEEIIVFYLKNDTIITKEERDRKRYETFKLKWLIEHGYGLRDVLKEVDWYLQDNFYNISIWSAFDLFEHYGFEDGVIYPCFKEWIDNEGKVTQPCDYDNYWI